MAALPARRRRRRRPGGLAQPINARTYRGTWLLVGIPLLVAAFSVRTAQPLPPPALPPTFSSAPALDLTLELARLYPVRRPGTATAASAASWVGERLREQGLRPELDSFTARVTGGPSVQLTNVAAEVPGRTPDAIVVMAHRDDTGAGPGADDNASGTGALIELTRLYSGPGSCAPGRAVNRSCPLHRIVFLSTDGGAYGALGADRFARTVPYRNRIVAVVNLDSIAAARPPRIVIAGLAPRAAPPTLVATAAARILDGARTTPRRTSPGGQLVDLAFPLTFYEQGPFVGRGIAAITLTRGADRPPAGAGDTTTRLSGARLGELGRAAENLVASLDASLGVPKTTSSAVFLGDRFVPGWAIQLVLIACLLPFLVAVVDLFARCRRRGIALAPAWRSLRSRLGFWLWTGVVVLALSLAGAWPDGPALPPSPAAPAAGHWPVLPLAVLVALSAIGWLVARERLLPRRPVDPAETVAGHAVALVALAIIAIVVVALNPFALVFLLPSLHAWIWLPQLSERSFVLRTAALAAGALGPAVLLGSLAFRFGFGLDAPWYLTLLVIVGYVPVPSVLVGLAWLAAGGQLAALAGGRYAPYPSRRERPPRGPIRETVRRVVLAFRAARRRRQAAGEPDVAFEEG